MVRRAPLLQVVDHPLIDIDGQRVHGGDHMLDFARFLHALRSDGGLERDGVHLTAETLTGLRGHEAYAFAWFENWSRDGQPADGRIAVHGPYPTSPDVDVSDFAVAGYAQTGDEPAAPAPAPARTSARRAARAAAAMSDRDQAVVVTGEADQPQLSTPSAPGPGWYPSPSRASHEQWWDGRAWTTEHRSVPARPRGLARLLRRRRASEDGISR